MDKSKATQLQEIACAGGNLAGCAWLGIHETGGQRGANMAKGVELLERACNGGDMLGCAALGELQWRGVGVPRDRAQGLKLAQRACDAGEVDGCSILGDRQRNAAPFSLSARIDGCWPPKHPGIRWISCGQPASGGPSFAKASAELILVCGVVSWTEAA